VSDHGSHSQEIAGEAADKVFAFLSTHMAAATVADALITAGVVDWVAELGRAGAADMLRRLAARVEGGEPPSVH
jgi:hypothetical protein